MKLSQRKYKEKFGIQPLDKKKACKALDYALDIRKFEIGLYWQRAAYFWALIAAAFAGYFTILGSEHLDDKEYLAYVLGLVGMLFTWAWFLVNRGSKFWQENWENHVDMLEDAVIGPLYKTVMYRAPGDKFIERTFVGPLPISVSKINQWVSTFTLAIWTALVWHVLPTFYFSLSLSAIAWRYVLLMVITVVAAALMACLGRTYKGAYKHVARKRMTMIVPLK